LRSSVHVVASHPPPIVVVQFSQVTSRPALEELRAQSTPSRLVRYYPFHSIRHFIDTIHHIRVHLVDKKPLVSAPRIEHACSQRNEDSTITPRIFLSVIPQSPSFIALYPFLSSPNRHEAPVSPLTPTQQLHSATHDRPSFCHVSHQSPIYAA